MPRPIERKKSPARDVALSMLRHFAAQPEGVPFDKHSKAQTLLLREKLAVAKVKNDPTGEQWPQLRVYITDKGRAEINEPAPWDEPPEAA